MPRIRGNQAPKNLKRIDNSRNHAVLANHRNESINISFKYLLEDSDFHLNHNDVAYLKTATHRFRDVCKMGKQALISNRSGALKFHQVDFNDKKTSRDKFGIPNEDDLCAEAYQFSLSKNEHGRIVGFFTGVNTFNIVWFDKDHRLYPGKNK